MSQSLTLHLKGWKILLVRNSESFGMDKDQKMMKMMMTGWQIMTDYDG